MGKNLSAEMLEVVKSSKEKLDTFKRGVYLENKIGKTIEAIRKEACVARWALSVRFLQYAKKANKERPSESRLVIARSYYAMYHAARAVVFNHIGGDDHEAHSELPKHLPNDFPNRLDWQNKLRNARLERNRADYDPFPKSEKAYVADADATFADALGFIVAAKSYLLAKNIPL